MKEDPERWALHKAKRKIWEEKNKDAMRLKQRLMKRSRKLQAIEYLGGVCLDCKQQFHPSVYEFHHRDPLLKDRDPSKTLGLSEAKMKSELDKCDLLCANCHRMRHHTWEEQQQ
jgi:predicted HNH restriction endonuclease